MNSIRKRRQREITSISINASKSLDKTQVESILSEFIDANSGKNLSNLNQLKRVQRDLRGLPPLLADEILEGKSEDIIETENEHGDIDMEGNETISDKIEEDNETETTSLSKEEQKQLKKELHKKEKKNKEKHKKEKKDKKEKKHKKRSEKKESEEIGTEEISMEN